MIWKRLLTLWTIKFFCKCSCVLFWRDSSSVFLKTTLCTYMLIYMTLIQKCLKLNYKLYVDLYNVDSEMLEVKLGILQGLFSGLTLFIFLYLICKMFQLLNVIYLFTTHPFSNHRLFLLLLKWILYLIIILFIYIMHCQCPSTKYVSFKSIGLSKAYWHHKLVLLIWLNIFLNIYIYK